jgi:hypothetical protein
LRFREIDEGTNDLLHPLLEVVPIVRAADEVVLVVRDRELVEVDLADNLVELRVGVEADLLVTLERSGCGG